MEIVIEFPGPTTATMTDGQWSGDAGPEVIAALNKNYSPGSPAQVGDHRLPPGVAAALRGAEVLGGTITKAPVYPDLPQGAVS